MKTHLKLFDVVALKRPVPERGLACGQVGTIVETLDDGFFEVEFSDDEGRAYAFAALCADDLIKLVYAPVAAAGLSA